MHWEVGWLVSGGMVRTSTNDVVVYFEVGAIFCHYCCWECEEYGGEEGRQMHFCKLRLEGERWEREKE